LAYRGLKVNIEKRMYLNILLGKANINNIIFLYHGHGYYPKSEQNNNVGARCIVPTRT